MIKKNTSTEQVKKALSETTRAISKQSDLNIDFENNAPKNDQNNIQLTRISNKVSKNDIIFSRGESDSKAFYLRYHDSLINQKYAPSGDIALNIFNEMEKARCEAIGGIDYPGAAKNIANKIETHNKKFYERCSQSLTLHKYNF